MTKILPMALAAAMLLPAFPAQARNGQSGYSNQCFKEVYREEYIPGTQSSPGRVRRWTESKEVPCNYPQRGDRYSEPAPRANSGPVDDNSCLEGSILGGIAGAAGGAALSRDEGLFIGIPLGIVTGSLIGCQLDGGG